MVDSSNEPASPSAAEGAVRHRAPPPDRRPRSRLAVWALLVALGCSGAAFALNLLWPLVVPALAFAVWAALKIRPKEETGQGFIFLAILLALLVGGFSLVGTVTMLDLTEHLANGVLVSAGVEGTPEEDRDRVAKWFTREADEGGAPDRLRERYEAVVSAVGPYEKELLLPSMLLGLNGLKLVPSGIQETEIGKGIGDPFAPHRDAVWVKARFRDATIWVELVLGEAPFEDQKHQIEELRKRQPSRLLADIRFFRIP